MSQYGRDIALIGGGLLGVAIAYGLAEGRRCVARLWSRRLSRTVPRSGQLCAVQRA